MKYYDNVRNAQIVTNRKRRRAAVSRAIRIGAYATTAASIVLMTCAFASNGAKKIEARAVVLDEPAIAASTVQTEETAEPEATEKVEESSYIIYDVPLSEELQEYTQDVCEEYEVSYPLVVAIMQKESHFDEDAISATKDYGIMQINSGNHEWLEEMLGITDWFDPKQNILAGVYILSQFNGYEDVHQILMSYNCGPTGAKNLWADGIYSTAYSRAVVEILDGLEVKNIE